MQISLEFLSELPLFETEKPYELFLHEIPEELPKTNCEYTTHNDIPIVDARSVDKVFSLDDCGFSFLPAAGYPAPSIEEFESVNATDIILSYLEDTISFVSRHIEADRILCFDWRVGFIFLLNCNVCHNLNMYSCVGTRPCPNGRKTLHAIELWHLKPLPRFTQIIPMAVVSVDYGASSQATSFESIVWSSGESDLLSRNSFCLVFKRLLNNIYSVWRPLVPVVEDCPLALCDRTTVPKSDLLEADKIHHDHLEEGYYVKYNTAHQWYWLSGQSSDEVTMFVTWDSDHESFEKSSVSPHAAFNNPNARVGCRPRESVEVRLMLFNKR